VEQVRLPPALNPAPIDHGQSAALATAATPSVELAAVTKRFGAVAAVDEVTLAVRRGELFGLLGPSGCGKTTLLRLIAGLEQPSAGRVRIGGRDVSDLPAHRRQVNLVFQHYALFPHLSVAQNVAFGLRYQGLRRAAAAARVGAALDLVRLRGLDGRYPHQLSGGQRQRVALARALALEPHVLLLDEPLAALDQELRQAMQLEIKRLQRTLGITFILVTHDQQEALALSDRVAVMNLGRIEQIGPPAEIFERPETAFVATFTGAANLWEAELLGRDAAGRLRLALGDAGDARAGGDVRGGGNGGAGGNGANAGAGGSVRDAGPHLEVDEPPGAESLRPGDRVRLAVRPEKLELRPAATASAGAGAVALPVTLEESIYQGARTVWVVRDPAGDRRVVHLPSASPLTAALSTLAPGAPAVLSWESRHSILLRR
jgi:ABC-type Fe3+/spermidine/putrescine transport system ATPase subunit